MRTGVYSGLIHTGAIPSSADPMQAAETSGSRWALVLGAPAGYLLGKTLLAGHPILWGIGLWAVGGYMAIRGLFKTCTCLMGSCNDANGNSASPTDPTALTSCTRSGNLSGGLGGLGIGSIIAGSPIIGGAAAILVGVSVLYSMYKEKQADSTPQPPAIAAGQSWSTTYQGHLVTIANSNGAYLMTLYTDTTPTTPMFEGVFGSAADAMNEAAVTINTGSANVNAAVATAQQTGAAYAPGASFSRPGTPWVGGRPLGKPLQAPTTLIIAAQALVAALSAMPAPPTYPFQACRTFQSAWNSVNVPALQVDGEYGPCTQWALSQILLGVHPAQAFGGSCVNGQYHA